MTERLVDTWVQFTNNSWWTGSIPKETVNTIHRAYQEGGQWHGTIILKRLDCFPEGQKVYIKDLLVKQECGRIGKN